ncbi:MAG TPA: heavy metal-binding domain-containing protein [Saprospiraceae bacterium]|nr:heavy metal-binding domain-containing protein [Saprospiraceae bacterium]
MFAFFLGTLLVTSCKQSTENTTVNENEHPMENVTDNLKEAANDAGDVAKDAVNDVKEAGKEAMDAAGDAMDDMMDATDNIVKSGKEYTSAFICPMHCKDSGSDKAGKCPKCGMDYVKNEDEHAGHNH